MENNLEIKRIDLLVHPFFYRKNGPGEKNYYSEKEAGKLLELWKKHVDEIASHPDRLLLVVPTVAQPEAQKMRSIELIKYAKARLGDRFGYFMKPDRALKFQDASGKTFESFQALAKAKGFSVNPEKVKTRGFGEYATDCVTDYLAYLNKKIGLKNIIPYRNRQSTILPRESVSAYSMWAIRKPEKSAGGIKAARDKARKFSRRRLEKANQLARTWNQESIFRQRTHLKKKRA